MNWLKPREPQKPDVKSKMEDAFTGSSVIDFVSPFKKNSLNWVMFWIQKDHRGQVAMHAKVKYKNENSEGETQINAETFQALVDKVNTFINGMAP